jgi:hypothetical protein
MMARTFMQLVVASGLLLGGIGICAIAAVPGAYAKDFNKTLRIEGTLLAVDATAGTVSIDTRLGSVVVIANRSTKIERNGRRTILPNLRPGDYVEARLAAGSGNIATKIEAIGP